MDRKKYQIIVIGAGAGGLVIALACAKAKKKVLLIEKGTWGGDCTNFGCIPSKSLIASADCAYNISHAEKMGITLETPKWNADNALERVRQIVDRVRSHEDAKSLEKEHIETLTGTACFLDTSTLEVTTSENKILVRGEKIVIAAGSSPRISTIEGLEGVPFLTNETIFSLPKVPKSLLVIGGGPIGCELAQAFSRLGSEVSIVHKHDHILNKEMPEAANIVQKKFEEEKISLYLGSQTKKVEYREGNFHLTIEQGNIEKTLVASQLLLSSGRKANIEDLSLDKAHIATNEKGIITDSYARSSQKHIFAIGDITGPPFFTHLAENRARSLVRNLLVPSFLRKKVDIAQPIPRVTYTAPELAVVGISPDDAIAKYGKKKIAVYHFPLSKVDRAITSGHEEGFISIVTKKLSSKILGATIVGERAGELLSEILVAMHENIPLRKLSSIIHPYPTFSLGIRQAADLWLKETILPMWKKDEKKDLS